MSDDILKMRRVVQWADGQNESFWLPVDESRRPAMAQIARAFETVELWERENGTVFSLEDVLYEMWLRDKEKYLELCSALNREPYTEEQEQEDD